MLIRVVVLGCGEVILSLKEFFHIKQQIVLFLTRAPPVGLCKFLFEQLTDYAHVNLISRIEQHDRTHCRWVCCLRHFLSKEDHIAIKPMFWEV